MSFSFGIGDELVVDGLHRVLERLLVDLDRPARRPPRPPCATRVPSRPTACACRAPTPWPRRGISAAPAGVSVSQTFFDISSISGRHRMVGQRVVLGDFEMARRVVRRPVVLRAVDDAGLQRRVDLAIRHRRRVGAHRLQQRHPQVRLLDADLHALDVGQRLDRLLGRVQRARARVVEREADVALRLRRPSGSGRRSGRPAPCACVPWTGTGTASSGPSSPDRCCSSAPR